MSGGAPIDVDVEVDTGPRRDRCSRSRDLRVRFDHGGAADLRAVNGLELRADGRADAGHHRRVGLGQDRQLRGRIMGLLPATATVVGLGPLRGRRAARAVRRGDAPPPRRQHRDGLPGPVPVAEPDDAHRHADRRGGPRRTRASIAAAARDRALELLKLVRLPVARAAPPRVPAPALGRHAPARRDRDRAGLRAEAADRRRGDDRARRDDAGADHGAAARAAAPSSAWR